MFPAEEIPENSMIGRIVGPYRLDEEVGRGGMGVVYRAARVDGEFDQTVAVKLIKRGMDTDLVLKRFRRERQITAALDHPNIAQFFGGGSTADGLPYFVMEFITGLPLYRYCDANRLALRRRLEVFRQVCWAVQAAHERQVIHRDLKPSNILVNENGRPKLLDFGIAKVLDPEFEQTGQEPTATQLRVMTPEYASPEQISGGEVGPESDIYSLGVILYELLSGHRPYRFSRRAHDEVARIIRTEEPASPSGSLTSDDHLVHFEGNGASLKAVLDARDSSLEELKRQLSGDLDKIVLKALRKRPEERYRSAGELADDITNFLEGRPVMAEAFPTLRNYAAPRGRGRTSLAVLPFKMQGAAAEDTGDEFLGIGLADALITRLSGVPRIIVRPTSSILPFRNADPFAAAGSLGVRFILDSSVRRSASRLRVSVQLLDLDDHSTPWARSFDADLQNVQDLEDRIAGQVARALLPELTRDEEIRLGKKGAQRSEAYEAYLRGRYLTNRFTNRDLMASADAFRQAIEIDPGFALPYIGLADFYVWSCIFGELPSRDGFPRAIDAARKALEIDDSLGEAYAVLAFAVFMSDWNWAEGEALVKRALELNPNHPFAHECYSNILVSQGRFDEGIREIETAEALEPASPRAILMTSWTLYQARRYREAVQKARKANEMQENFPQGLLHLGNSLWGTGEYDEAVRALRKSAEIWGGSGLPRYLLCFARAAQGNMEASRKILEKLLRAQETGYVKPYFVAMCYAAVNEPDRAFEWFERAVDEGNEWMIWFGTEPKLDPLRSDPRFKKLLLRTTNPIAHQPDRIRPTEEPPKTIAVLPFRMISAFADDASSGDEYLRIGLADSVTMRLSNVRRFVVRPTSSVLPFAAEETDPFAAGRELGVEYIVDGIIRRLEDSIRVTAQLINVPENAVVWAASFSEGHGDVLELEDSISEQVTRQLVPFLTGDERIQLAKRGTRNAAAHDAYLQGRYFWNQFTPEGFPKAIAAFRRAVELDPEYALAHVGIADYFTWACIYGMVPPAEGAPRVFEAATRALEIDDSLAEGHAALGLYLSNNRQWEAAEDQYRRAIELNPGYPLAHEWLSSVLVGTGRFEEGIAEIFNAERLDPLSLRPKVLSAWTIYQTRRFNDAAAKAREIETLAPDFMQAHLQLSNILLHIGETERAVEHGLRAIELAPGTPLPVYPACFALVAAGRKQEAEDILARWESAAGHTYVAPYFLAMCSLAVGDRDRFFDRLDQALAEKSAWMLWLGTEPKLDVVRGDPRLVERLSDAGLPRM